VFIPFVLSLYDSFRFQRPRSRGDEEPSVHNLHETVYDALHRWYLDSRFRYVFPAFLVSFGSFLASGLWTGASSTFICPLVVGQTRTVPLMQFFCVALDSWLAIAVYELCLQKSSKDKEARAKTPLVWSSILLVRILTEIVLTSC
jgi:hypothetical protein